MVGGPRTPAPGQSQTHTSVGIIIESLKGVGHMVVTVRSLGLGGLSGYEVSVECFLSGEIGRAHV